MVDPLQPLAAVAGLWCLSFKVDASLELGNFIKAPPESLAQDDSKQTTELKTYIAFYQEIFLFPAWMCSKF